MEVKRFFWLVQKSTWYPCLSSRGSSEPQAQWSPSLAAQPKLCCKYSPLPCFAPCIKNLTCLWSLLTEEDREHLGSHWCGGVGRDQQILAGPSQSCFLSPFFNNHKPIDTWKVVVNTWTTSFSKNQSFLTMSTIDKVLAIVDTDLCIWEKVCTLVHRHFAQHQGAT